MWKQIKELGNNAQHIYLYLLEHSDAVGICKATDDEILADCKLTQDQREIGFVELYGPHVRTNGKVKWLKNKAKGATITEDDFAALEDLPKDWDAQAHVNAINKARKKSPVKPDVTAKKDPEVVKK